MITWDTAAVDITSVHSNWRQIKPLFAEGAVHSYAPISQEHIDFPAGVISSLINYY